MESQYHAFNGHDLPHLGVDEFFGGLQASVKALHVPDLQDLAGAFYGIAQAFGFFNRQSQWLFAQHMLSRFKGANGGWHVEGIRRGDDDGIHSQGLPASCRSR